MTLFNTRTLFGFETIAAKIASGLFFLIPL